MVEPAFCAAATPLAGPPAARERTIALVAAQAVLCEPSNAGLMLFDPGHAAVLSTSPRHTRHVPIRTPVVCAGSSRNGGSISDASFATCVVPMVGEPVKFTAVHV